MVVYDCSCFFFVVVHIALTKLEICFNAYKGRAGCFAFCVLVFMCLSLLDCVQVSLSICAMDLAAVFDRKSNSSSTQYTALKSQRPWLAKN